MGATRTQKSDPTGRGEKGRYLCPAGHRSWERTNNHAWCHACSREIDHNPDADPEWHALYDQVADEYVPFDELKEMWPPIGEVSAY